MSTADTPDLLLNAYRWYRNKLQDLEQQHHNLRRDANYYGGTITLDSTLTTLRQMARWHEHEMLAFYEYELSVRREILDAQSEVEI